jgi:hypothetical protein
MSDQSLYDLADEFINKANELGKDWSATRLSAAMLYATARFNAYNYFKIEDDPSAKHGMEYFTDQYRTMLKEHLDFFEAQSKETE